MGDQLTKFEIHFHFHTLAVFTNSLGHVESLGRLNMT